MEKNATLKQILEDTRRLVSTKTASFEKKALVGQSPESMPGSEHDSKVTDEAKKPSKETRDGSMVPNSGLSTEGAKDDSPVTRGHALEADESAETPTKKPAVDSDANAKTAEGPAKMVNDILSLIREAQKTEKVAAPAEKVAAPVKEEPKVAAPAAEKKSGLDMELTTDVMAKIAAALLSTEEGAELVETMLTKQAGAQKAQEVLAYLAAQSEEAEKQAAYLAGEADAQKLIDEQIYLAGLKAGEEKAAAAFNYKLGQAAAEAASGGPAALEGAVPGAGEAVDGMAAAPAEGGEVGGEEITIEDVAAALEELVNEGELKPEEAQEVIQALVGGEDQGAAPDEGAPAEVPAEAAPAEGAPAEEPKEASVNKAASLLEAIRAISASRK